MEKTTEERFKDTREKYPNVEWRGKDIEERAKDYAYGNKEPREYDDFTPRFTDRDMADCREQTYRDCATEQKAIDDKVHTADLEAEMEYSKHLWLEQACDWMQTHLPRVMEYHDGEITTAEMLNEDMREEFRKAMEE